MTKAVLTILVLLITGFSYGQNKGTLNVQINKLRNTKGHVLVSLYNKAEGFPRNKKVIFRTEKVKVITGRSVTVSFRKIPYGNYAVAVLHDENQSGDMDYRFFGIPKEGYCFSNNAVPFLSPPSFDQAKFRLNRSEKIIKLNMRY